MIRFFGAAMVGVVLAYFGFSSASRLKERRDYISEFITSLSVLETEMEFGRYSLKELFELLDKRFGRLVIYGKSAECIDESGIKKAWCKACDEIALYVGAEERSIIKGLGDELGMSDVRGQKRALSRTSALLSELQKSAAEDYERLSRVYRWCGVLAGVFVVLAVI